VPPALFVPLAEDSNLIRMLDQQVLLRACQDFSLLQRRGAVSGDVRLAVNVSARNTDADTLCSMVVDAAAKALMPLGALEVEVTETALMNDLGGASEGLQALRDLGVHVALDDFGTGYSSLTYLRRLPVTTIKIDREFIEHITDRPDDLAITASIADLGHAIGLRTVAEGVETTEQLAMLVQLGCTAGQGYLWSPALPLDDLVALLAAHPSGFGPPPPSAIAPPALPEIRSRHEQVTEEHGLSRLLDLHRPGRHWPLSQRR
jgi:EAL domain-containing protein (putative c-di-GMP-specific phosphodiesterase class I)